ncbi:glycosyltransferase [Methylocystis sp. 9N]|uniref:Glycosyltransferase n=1 Tax=Methylocystis borbori TaxID=3118750 RepID=A0ABU7XC46_9HYPH
MRRGLRIALTVDPELPVPPLHYGGIERIVDMLARELVSRGHEVTLFANPRSTCPVHKIAWPGARSNSRLDTIRNAVTLTRAVAFGGFDIVHSFSRIAYMTPILPAPIPKLMSYQREVSRRTTALAQKLAFGSLEFSAISRSMIEPVRHIGEWHYAPNGVSLSAYAFQAKVDSDAPLVFLGRIEEIKGPHLAIEAARRAGCRLVLAGNVPSEHRGWFEANVQPHIDGREIAYIGPVDDAQKSELLGRARALLMPILWEEPFGIVMAEAMACGAPVIGFRRGAVAEVVEDGTTGYVVDTLDDMAAAVDRLPNLERRACRARVERLFSEIAVADSYLQIYAQMLSRRQKERRIPFAQ